MAISGSIGCGLVLMRVGLWSFNSVSHLEVLWGKVRGISSHILKQQTAHIPRFQVWDTLPQTLKASVACQTCFQAWDTLPSGSGSKCHTPYPDFRSGTLLPTHTNAAKHVTQGVSAHASVCFQAWDAHPQAQAAGVTRQSP